MTSNDLIAKVLLENLFDHVVILDEDFRIIGASRSYAGAYGHEPEELVGTHCYKISHGQDEPCRDSDRQCPLTAALRQQAPVTVRHAHPCGGGESLHLEIKAIPFVDTHTGVPQFVMILRDIAAVTRLEQSLASTSRQSDFIFESGNIGLLIMDQDLRITRANPNASDMIGIPAEALSGMSLRRFLTKDDADILEGACKQIGGDSTKHICTEVELRTASGKHMDIEACLSIMPHGDGTSIYAYLRDITFQKRVENKLYEATQKFQKIAEMGEDAILVLGEGCQVEFANSRASDLTGYSRKELIGMDFLTLLGDKGRVFFEDLCKEPLVDEGRRVCTEMELSTAYGRRYTCEVCIRMAASTEGSDRTYVYIRDLSERIRIEHKLRETNEFLTNLIESSIDGIIAADTRGNVIIFNEGAERLLGYKAEDVIGKMILVVDDDRVIVETITAALEEDPHEYEVISAADGFEAGIQVSHFRPDLLILDIMMPDIDGYEVCRTVKRSESTKHTKIIVLSGYLDDDNYRKMREYGADLCFSKPLPIDKLKEEIARLLFPGTVS